MGKASSESVSAIADWLGDRPEQYDAKIFRKSDIKKMLKVWQKRLEMQDIAIHFDPDEEPPESGANASIWMADDYHYGVLRLKSGWAYTAPWNVNQKVLHELMHVRLKPYDDVFDQLLEKLSPELREVFAETRRHVREGIVEYLANALLDAYGPIKGTAK